ncbi:MAG: phosphatidylglycerophosphatase A [Desulfamplus sp.]|nr:phosphatidylglycerophosphatase A [Desulfamplus sp.]
MTTENHGRQISIKRISIAERLKIILGSACYLGYSPAMPGTFGALPGIAIYFILWKIMPSNFLRISLLAVVVALMLLNYYLTPWAIRYWRSKDPSQFVLDEIIGFLCVPIYYGADDFNRTALMGFILFRILDMIKIFPANYVDKNVKGSTGIIFDDVISAGYAALILFLFDLFKSFNLI